MVHHLLPLADTSKRSLASAVDYTVNRLTRRTLSVHCPPSGHCRSAPLLGCVLAPVSSVERVQSSVSTRTDLSDHSIAGTPARLRALVKNHPLSTSSALVSIRVA